MRFNDRLSGQLLLGTAPLLVWAAHFSFCYAYAAVGCAAGLQGMAPLLWASVIAMAMVLALLLRSVLDVRRRRASRRLLDAARIGSAALALIGMGWTSVPMLLLAVCG